MGGCVAAFVGSGVGEAVGGAECLDGCVPKSNREGLQLLSFGSGRNGRFDLRSGMSTNSFTLRRGSIDRGLCQLRTCGKSVGGILT